MRSGVQRHVKTMNSKPLLCTFAEIRAQGQFVMEEVPEDESTGDRS